MTDAIVSVVAEQIIGLLKEQARYHVNLVRGAEKEVRSLSDELKRVRNVLDDAENRRFKDSNVKDWLVRLEHTSYAMDDVLDEWNYAILKLQIENHQSEDDAKQKVCGFIPSFSCLCFKKAALRHDIAKKILNVKAQLDDVLKVKDRYNFVMSQPSTSDPLRVPSTSFTDLAEVRGRDSDREILVTKLIAKREELGVQVVSIVGVGGLGKTTLAQLVYNDSRVEKSFDLRIWFCVSDPFDLAAIAKGIIGIVEKRDPPSDNNLETLLQRVRDSISGKKFLLVLDDVWSEDPKKWEPLKSSLKSCCEVGSKVLVTTRNRNVAEIMGTMDGDTHDLEKLTDEDCWLLLSSEAFSGRNKEKFETFKDMSVEIAGKCKGLPLAARVLGSLLRSKSSLEDWKNVLNSEIWQLERAEVELFPHLLLSYNELSPMLKRCFSYCAFFPKDSKIDVQDLIGKWMALGYLGSNIDDMELRGRECFEVLAMHSLFQEFERDDLDGRIESCKMHDIVHDFAQFLRRSSRVEAAGLNSATCGSCDPSLVSTVNEYCSLNFDNDKNVPPNLCSCLKRLRMLSLSCCGLRSVPQGMENLIHLRWLNLDYNSLSLAGIKIIFQLYNLRTLSMRSCHLKEIPSEIGNLIHLRWLNLSRNNLSLADIKIIFQLSNLQTLSMRSCHLKEIPSEIGNLIHLRCLGLGDNDFKELPESICGLHELRTWSVDWCESLIRLPEGMHRLINLKHIDIDGSNNLEGLPQGVAQLTGLRRLDKLIGRSEFGVLKNLNHLAGSLKLDIMLDDGDDLEEVVRDVREAELKKKIHIQELQISFEGDSEKKGTLDLLEALEPHPNLQKLRICFYKGPKLPAWIVSPGFNHLREIILFFCNDMSSLPPLGKLPCLEEIVIYCLFGLEFVGREMLGIRGGDMVQSSFVAFPKLKTLKFSYCYNWEEWEDITAEEEEESAAVSFMPCLIKLTLSGCRKLRMLPHRLLRKASSLEVLDLSYSKELEQRYGDGESKSIFQNPRLQIKWSYQQYLFCSKIHFMKAYNS